MQDVTQLSTLSKGTEAASLSSCSAEKNPYIKAKRVKEVFQDINEIRCLHAYYTFRLELSIQRSIAVICVYNFPHSLERATEK
uniref:Uncharacterized protein n=1 Tax=Arundo donax TaxID=35708 RepID=A0A0A9EN98_ARUDO